MRYVDDSPGGAQLEYDDKTGDLKIYDEDGEVVYIFPKESTIFLKEFLSRVLN